MTNEKLEIRNEKDDKMRNDKLEMRNEGEIFKHKQIILKLFI